MHGLSTILQNSTVQSFAEPTYVHHHPPHAVLPISEDDTRTGTRMKSNRTGPVC